MLNKPYKTITDPNLTGKIEIYGNHHWIELKWGIPEYKQEEYKENNTPEEDQEVEEYFDYKGRKYFLSEFTNIHNKVWSPNPPEWQKEFDGIKNDSYFSGF